MEEEEDELECAVNLESFPLSRGSHECVAAWSLVSLQEDNSEKKSFLMAHTRANQSLVVPFCVPSESEISSHPGAQIPSKRSAADPPRKQPAAPETRGGERRRRQDSEPGGGGGAKFPGKDAPFGRQSNRRRSPGIQKPNPTTGEADVERGG